MNLNPQQLATALEAFLAQRMPLLVTGAPGIGKSDIIAAAAKLAGFDLIISHPAVSDPTDFKGLPWPDATKKSAGFIPFGEFHHALTATRPTAWFFDDLGQASVAVQAACMQLFLARRVNGHILPDCIVFVGATNRRGDRAGVNGILETVKSRFDSIVELEPDIDSWCNWAFGHNIPPTMIAFLRYRPELLSKFIPSADLVNSPSPRTWSAAARIEALNLSAAIELPLMAGAVGEGAATEYLVFRKMVASLINLDAILKDPDKAAIPTAPDQLYATAVGLAAKANGQNFARIAVYCNRLIDSQHGEFAVLCIRDAVRKDEKLTYTDTFVRLASGPVGNLISGNVN
jgi:hypothetical protein